MASRTKLVEMGMAPPLAAEVARQVNSGTAEKAQIAALTAESTANATDLATAQALANALKTKVNAIIAALKA